MSRCKIKFRIKVPEASIKVSGTNNLFTFDAASRMLTGVQGLDSDKVTGTHHRFLKPRIRFLQGFLTARFSTCLVMACVADSPQAMSLPEMRAKF